MVDRIRRPLGNPPAWLESVLRSIEQAMRRPFAVTSYTVATVPDPAINPGVLIRVADEAGGDTLAWSDGTDWRRTSDNAVIS